MKKWMVIAAVIIILIMEGKFMYRYFATDRLMDGDGVENPDTLNKPEEIREVSETAELVEFFWHQNAMGYDDCFQFGITSIGQNSSTPRLYCSYMDWEIYERVEIGEECDSEACPPVSLERWKELSDFLREAELPAYRVPDPDLLDATVSKIQVTWRDGEKQFTNSYDGTSAHDLLKLLQKIAGEV